MSKDFKFTNFWFHHDIKNNLGNFLDSSNKIDILEIGCYEGLSTCFFLENFCLHPKSTITCVDPFNINDRTTPLTDNTKTNFYHNISLCDNREKVKVYETYSNNFFTENKKEYDFIYIDGSHELNDIIYDMNESDKCLRMGGIMWLDDYLGGDGKQIKDVMDKFVVDNDQRYKILFTNYQLGLIKLH